MSHLRLLLPALAAAHLVASAIGGTPTRWYVAISFVTFSAIVVAGDALLRRARMATTGVEEPLSAIDRLSVDAARERCVRMLRESSLFAVTEASEPFKSTFLLPPQLADFFALFERVVAGNQAATLDRQLVAPSALLSTFVRVGVDYDGAEISFRDSSDRIYEIEGDQPPTEEDSHQSVWHWILAVEMSLKR